jgi:Family of unknown function (DUF5715)
LHQNHQFEGSNLRRVHFIILTLLAGCYALPSFALNATTAKPHRYRHLRRTRHVYWNPVFRGTREALVRENAQLDMLQLPRIENDDQLLLLEQSAELVPLRESHYLNIAQNLAETRRYCRPWTRDFVEDFSQDFYKEFHRPIQLTSAVRTVQQQHKLRRHNRNAAPELGETASTHLTGVTVDILKRGLTRKQMQWINAYFMPLHAQGLVEPVEERRQPVFHIMVSNQYSEWRVQKLAIEQAPAFPPIMEVSDIAPGLSGQH